ncbi:MAG: hypothetical protein PW788_06905 [Micavibrio sp.]|nr:hypothetical protein [Micavibrio sp.]
MPKPQDRPQSKPEPEITLREIFNKAVREVHADFPQLKDRFTIISLQENRMHGNLTAEATGLEKAALNKYVLDTMQSSRDKKSSIASHNANAKIVVFNDVASHLNLFTSPNMLRAIGVMGIIDHEVGHLLVPDAMKYGTLAEKLYSEAAADTYAVIRNLQRFKGHGNPIEILSWQRALAFIEHGSQSHFTSFTLEAFGKVKDKIDFDALTPVETLHLARRFALENAPHESLMRNLLDVFQPYRDALATGMPYSDALKVLAEITLGPNTGYYTFRLGSIVLEQYLEGNIMRGGKHIDLQGPYWDEKRSEIATRYIQVSKEGILTGFPLKAAKQQPAANGNAAPKQGLRASEAIPQKAPAKPAALIDRMRKWF